MNARKKLEDEDYDYLVNAVATSLRREHPDVCFYVYGSYAEKRANPGVSDIDGGIILPTGPVTDKNKIREISKLIAAAREEVPPIKLQWNLMDRVTNRDGRFLSYNITYTNWFVPGNASILSGEDYLSEMNGMDNRGEELRSAAMNLRGMRNILLFAESNRRKPYDQRGSLAYELEKAMDKLTGLPKQLALICGEEFNNDKLQGAEVIGEVLPELDSQNLRWAIQARSSQDNFRKVIFHEDEEEILRSIERTVTGYEEIVDAFLKQP